MLVLLSRFPLLVNLSLTAAVAMLGPALHAVWLRDFDVAAAFLGSAFLWATLLVIVGLATSAPRTQPPPPRQVFLLLVAYGVLPVILATPVIQVVPSITFAQAYFEMLSCLTTTGATVLPEASGVPDPLHLWRGFVAWSGGLMILVTVVGVLAPMQMGGFEVEHASGGIARDEQNLRSRGAENTRARLTRHLRRILPTYTILTLILTLGLLIMGDRALVGLIHAMSIISTSGITPLDSFSDAASGRAGEALMFLFLIIVITRRTTSAPRYVRPREILDPEMQLALIAVAGVTSLLFFRHFLGAIEVDGQENFSAAFQALWGSLFSILSFLTTTGFESGDWSAMRNWSGLGTPGIILLSLCILGGGIATTTGGIKLLRVYALYKHGVREMQRLIHPSSVGGAGITARQIRRQGAQIAWVFLMLFTLAFSLSMLVLTALGQGFEEALVLSVAALTSTGPAVSLLDESLGYAALSGAELGVLSVVMVFGRLELLVLISVLNPSYWRG